MRMITTDTFQTKRRRMDLKVPANGAVRLPADISNHSQEEQLASFFGYMFCVATLYILHPIPNVFIVIIIVIISINIFVFR